MILIDFVPQSKLNSAEENLENATGEFFFLRYTPVSGNELPGYVDLVAWDLVLISRPSHLMWNLEPFSREGFHPKKPSPYEK